MAKQPGPTENEIQTALFGILRIFEARYWELETIYAIPNGGKLPYGRNRRTGKVTSPQRIKLVKEGMRSGIPDICIPYGDGVNSGMYIEMKRPGKRTSDKQDKMIGLLRKLNHAIKVCDSAEEALILIYSHTAARYLWLAQKQKRGSSHPELGNEDFGKKALNFERDLIPVLNSYHK